MTKNKSRIAILTQPLGFNYGGIIQNYALQKVLKDFGHNVITITRGGENPHSQLKILGSKCKSVLLRYIFKHRKLIFLDYIRITKLNRNFIARHIKTSPLMHTSAMMQKYFLRKKFDLVIVGSDQVWRPKYSPDIFNYFLDFLYARTDIKKITYAASFGTEIWEFSDEHSKICRDLVQHFDGVSVREDSAVKLCADNLNRKDAIHVLDPTLLLNAEDYSKLINKDKQNFGLFTYILDESSKKLAFAKNCAVELSLTIHKNQANLLAENIDIDHLQEYVIPSLEGWLQGFRDADFVITDSFHGTIFSIINKKPFFVIVNNDRGATRFESLLKQLGLEDRLIYDVQNFDFLELKKNISYDNVFLRLKKLRLESLFFLKKFLDNGSIQA